MAKRPRGFINGYRPRSKAVLLEQVHLVLAEYRDQLPLTCRQIFYRLVGRFDYEKTENAYSRLQEMLVLARRGGVIPFDHIRDDGNHIQAPSLFSSGDDFLRTCQAWAQSMRLSPWDVQPRYVEVICEAGGMVPMLARVAGPYGVTVRSGGGFDSVTAKHDLARFYAGQDKPAVVLHIGDYDPSGETLWNVLNEDVGAFCTAMGGELILQRIAVTPDQQRQFDLQTSPPKKTDKRKAYFDDEITVQAEALPPDLLQQIVGESIAAEMDLDLLDRQRSIEAEVREQLVARLAGVEPFA
ncbi:hypothetical protein [Synechococcus sp. MIT S1220]|uniref:hypothetical protein n=1 Tax=Synechococcus sp. MIT S1220 TaxID=3082549 RepID=UPI0039B0FB00